MYPILFRTEFGFVYTFTVIWLAGILICLGVILRLTGWHKNAFQAWIDFALLCGLLSLLFGRAQFVLQNQEYFLENRAEQWELFAGGLGYLGAVAGFAVAVVIFSIWKPEERGLVIPRLPLVLVWGHFVGWVACYFEGCGYGRIGEIAWYTADLPDTFGVYAVRFQTQLAGILLFLLIFSLISTLFTSSRVTTDGQQSFFGCVLVICLLTQIGILFFRGDPVPMWSGYRFDIVIGIGCILLIVISIPIYTIIMRVNRNE